MLLLFIPVLIALLYFGGRAIPEDKEEPLEFDESPLLARIIDAWDVPGVSPEYHEYMKQWLLREWPVLSRAIEDASSKKKELTT